MRSETTQVAIIGGGPNGITAAHYMGLYGIDCVVLELAETILPFPRAVGMDDEALRVLQTVGVAELALRDGHSSASTCLIAIDVGSSCCWSMRMRW